MNCVNHIKIIPTNTNMSASRFGKFLSFRMHCWIFTATNITAIIAMKYLCIVPCDKCKQDILVCKCLRLGNERLEKEIAELKLKNNSKYL